MTYTVTQLINKAYYLSQVTSRELQTVSGSQFTDGLDLLNALLNVKASDVRLIPYYTRDTFNTVAGQEKYSIDNLILLETLTFNIGTVQFPMTERGRVDYFGSGRVDDLLTLPVTYHCERALDGLDIYLYPLPNAVYVMTYMGKKGLTNVTATTDLSAVYDLYYIEYLRYALAEYICCDWGVNMPEQAYAKFKEIRKKLQDIDPPDLLLQKNSTLQQNNYGNNFWAIANFSNGWLPRNTGGR